MIPDPSWYVITYPTNITPPHGPKNGVMRCLLSPRDAKDQWDLLPPHCKDGYSIRNAEPDDFDCKWDQISEQKGDA